MPDITLGEMLTLIFSDLATSVEQTDDEAGVKLQVTSLDLDLPASVRVDETRTPAEEPRLVVALPSTRETPSGGRLGRIALTIGVEKHNPPAPAPAPTPLEEP
jgi:hypothetical protein